MVGGTAVSGAANAVSGAASAVERHLPHLGLIGRKDSGKAKVHKHSFESVARTVVILALVFIACFAIYPVAQNYYKSTRNEAKLQAEYQAVSNRNAAIQQEIDYLSTNQGVEDSARSQFGYVMPGENAVTVSDVGNVTSSTALPTSVKTGSVKAPDTWYTKILDVIFQVG